MNYKEAYEYGKEKLREYEIVEAVLDARLLLEFICHTDRNDLLIHGDREVSEEEFCMYQNYIERRVTHEPLQHITGVQEFMGLTFEVNRHVLIPRQDTEILVEEAMIHVHDGMKILDMCTGSGCILLSLLHYSNDCHGTGVDISEEALKIACKNADSLKIDAQFIQGDLFENITDAYDILVSNPPYIETQVIDSLMKEVKGFEPMIALDGKEDGLYFYRKIVAQGKKHLLRGACLLFEIGYNQGKAVKDLMEQNGFVDVKIVRDLANLDRVVVGTFLEE